MKRQRIDDVMVRKHRQLYGRTEFAYCHLGHLHHETSNESNLMLVSQWPTLAAPDAYASRHGFMSQRMAPVITYHKEFGRSGGLDVTPAMLDL